MVYEDKKCVVVNNSTADLLKMQVTLHTKYIFRDVFFEWWNFLLITSMWNLGVMSISRLLVSQWDSICAPLVADLLLYSYEAEFAQHLQKSKFKNLTFLYIDDVLTLNNSKFNDHIDVISPGEP